MPVTRQPLRAAALALALALAGCFPGPDKVGELTRTSLQQYLQSDPQFKDSGAEVVRVQVTGGGDRKYLAQASVLHAGKTHEIPVTVVLDGINLEWYAAPAAFAFLAKPAPTPALQAIPK